MIRFFNTIKGKLEDFDLPAGSEVKMYTCGPTVYDYAHVGNFRAFVFEDLLRRFLEYKGYKVKHVMNITDVDDKTIAGANKVGAGPRACPEGDHGGSPLQRLNKFTEKYIQAFREDLQRLNILSPNFPKEGPRATREIPSMIELIEKLIKKDRAYMSDGSVYYRVSAFPSYGKLSKKKLEGNIKGARVDVDEYDKEEGADFVLWKKAKEEEPSWDSPWGKGRPGWHIECSAMSMKYLGETFDIHAGGEDLIFPHHENEIAQSEGATGKPFVKYWLHCKHLLVNGEKMSKSKGNFFTLRDLLAKSYDPMAIRYALISVHYGQQMNFTLKGLDEAKEVINKLRDCYDRCLSFASDVDWVARWYQKQPDAESTLPRELEDHSEAIVTALESDLNISVALELLFGAVRKINTVLSRYNVRKQNLEAALKFFKQMDRLFGLKIAEIDSVPEDIIEMLKRRGELRKNKDFKQTDELRKKIEETGWEVKDGRPGEPSTVRKIRRG